MHLHNRTPLVHSMLFWANPVVHVNPDYQLMFAPSMEYVAQHTKREMTAWPIAGMRYNAFDYTGVDISRWNNIGVPSSFFSWAPQEDFIGGYDHGKRAGTVWTGNRHTDEATPEFRQAVQQNPSHVWAHVHLAELDMYLERTDSVPPESGGTISGS